ncbi:acyl-CoA thioesterase [bacterium]|nr:acyl-CoA thioesterase [bacterium]
MARNRRQDYFETVPGGPPPLVARAVRQARFEEVDSLGIVWHGRYPSYLEDARIALGEAYSLRYLDMHRARFVAPIVQLRLDYHSPLTLDDRFSVEISFLWTEAVRLNSLYRIEGKDGRLIATGCTVQMLMNLDREVLVAWPEYMETFRQKWREGSFDSSPARSLDQF